MPKYSHYKLDVFLKKDAKVIKKQNKKILNSQILNKLSTFLGYKNYQEVTKRENNNCLLELIELNYDDFKSIISNYIHLVEKEFDMDSFNTHINDLNKNYHKLIIENQNPDSNEEKIIDFSKNNIGIIFDNKRFSEVLKLYFVNLHKKDKNKIDEAIKNLDLIFNIMTFFKVSSFQNEIKKYLDIEYLLERHDNITENYLRLKVASYFDDIGVYQKDVDYVFNHNDKYQELFEILSYSYFNLKNNLHNIDYIDLFSDKYNKIIAIFKSDKKMDGSLFEYFLLENTPECKKPFKKYF